MDKTVSVDVNHLTAAVAAWEYCVDSTKMIFGSRLGDPNADVIMAGLEAKQRLTRTEISKLFNGNATAAQIDSAMDIAIEQMLRCRAGKRWIYVGDFS